MENVFRLTAYEKKFFDSLDTLMYTAGYSEQTKELIKHFVALNKEILDIENPDELNPIYMGNSAERTIIHFETKIDNYDAILKLMFCFDLDGYVISFKKAIEVNLLAHKTEV